MQEIINTLINEHNQYVKSINFWSEFRSLINGHIIITTLVLIIFFTTLFSCKSLKHKLLVIVAYLLLPFIISGASYSTKKYLHDNTDEYIAKNLTTSLTQKPTGFNIYTSENSAFDPENIMSVNMETKKYVPESLYGLQYAALNDELVNQFGVNAAIKIINNNKIYNKHNNLEIKFVYKEKYYILVTSTHNHIINVNVK